MQSGLSSAIDRFRQPEYTGENRCVPCTTVNVVIALVVSGVAAIVNPVVGVVVLAVSLAAIYFRGYLVPGTPTLTKRYFPDWLLAKFDKGPAIGGGIETADPAMDDSHGPDPIDEREAATDPETALVESGIVEPCVDEDDLCLADDVREAWRSRMDDLRDGDRESQVAAFLEVDADDVSVSSSGTNVRVRVNGRLAARWESEGALLADLAGADVLDDRLPGWDDFPIEARSQLASGLRAFVETCPTCEGPISIDEETVESCCRSHQVYAVTCEDCGARILEVQQ